jgi:hypothetical protein
MRVRSAGILASASLALCIVSAARAQELVPRAYVVTPVTSNAVTVSYTRLDGSLEFAGAVPITDATATVNLPVLSYYHSFSLLGRSANAAVVLPYGIGDFQGLVAEVPRSAHRAGFLDSAARVSMNFLGGPAMDSTEFAKWTQKTLLGMSLTVYAPTGQYDPTRLINYGSNRWAFRPEIGYSQRWGHWVLDGYVAATFFTHNNEFLVRNVRAQRPVEAFEAHLSYDFGRRAWVSLDANFWRGGDTSLNGVFNPHTNQKSSRVGLTIAVPFTLHQSLKISYSDGAYVRYGGNYHSVSLAWQYAWIGWRLH